MADNVAEGFEGEADGVDEVDAGAHQTVAQFEAEEIVLGLGGTSGFSTRIGADFRLVPTKYGKD
jgi:hypothetical protein